MSNLESTPGFPLACELEKKMRVGWGVEATCCARGQTPLALPVVPGRLSLQTRLVLSWTGNGIG
jgi:hypothetical protein